MAQQKHYRTTPCANCPFRTDVRPYLTTERAREIATTEAQFPCHKTTTFDDEGETVRTGREQWCAGFLIMCEHEEQPNQMMRIAERVGLYDRTKLKMNAPVFKTFREFIDAQPKR